MPFLALFIFVVVRFQEGKALTWKRTSACTLSNCEKLMFRLKDDSSISSLRERSSVLKECSSVTAWEVPRVKLLSVTMLQLFNLLSCILLIYCTADTNTRPRPLCACRGMTQHPCLLPNKKNKKKTSPAHDGRVHAHAHLCQLFHQSLVVIG